MQDSIKTIGKYRRMRKALSQLNERIERIRKEEKELEENLVGAAERGLYDQATLCYEKMMMLKELRRSLAGIISFWEV